MPVLHRPNILFIVFDSLSMVDSGLLSSSTMPSTLARLAEKSTLFTNAYTPSPESSPARASLFTGLDPCAHGLWTSGVTLPSREKTFPETLALTGYTNWLVGRRQLAGVANWTTEHARPYEYAQFEWAHGPLHRSRQNAYLAWLQQKAPERYDKIFPLQANPDDTNIPPEQRRAMSELPDELSFNYWVGERIGDLIATHSASSSKQPFLVVAGFSVGSLMGTEPPKAHDGEALMARALQQADTALGGIVGQLEEKNLSDDTTIVVTAARGNISSETLEAPMHEQSIKVPLLIHQPGQKKRVIEEPVSTIDIAPTILDIAGMPTGLRMQGASLLNVLNGSESPRGWALSRLRRGGASDNNRNWQTAYRSGNMKLVVKHGDPQKNSPATYKLFDFSADPEEREDLAKRESHTAILEDMIDQMIDARCVLEDRTESRIASF